MITCSKRFSDIPFAHRQHKHDGHCAWIHGHNWEFEIEFAAETLDENGFVIDFGKLKFIKKWISDELDHSFLVNRSDPQLPNIIKHIAQPGLARVRVIPDGSAEGLAKFVFDELNPLVLKNSNNRVWIRRVIVREDEKNSATYLVPVSLQGAH